MKFTTKVFLIVISTSLFSIAYGHGDKKHTDDSEPVTYDPVSTEFGLYDPSLEADRTIEVSMSDTMRFTPDTIQVSAGETIKFVVANNGKLQHEFVLGTAELLKEHAAMMMKFPNMEHEEPYMAHVAPGETMVIMWQFSESGAFEFGCLIPGHFDAGMKGTVTVD